MAHGFRLTAETHLRHVTWAALYVFFHEPIRDGAGAVTYTRLGGREETGTLKQTVKTCLQVMKPREIFHSI